jgi:hypothetical protein
MKSIFKILILLFVLIISPVIFTKQASAQQPYVSFQVFYDQLSPYGQWVDYPDYGYVWIPDEGSDFVPYSTRGHWVFTDYGWTWVSDYNWGWAPFHYGRWDYSSYYGWFWVPDNEWGPAWVNWRSANGYYGWAPMEPGISISISFGRPYNSQNDHWIFVRDRYIDRSDVNRYYVNRMDHDRIIRDSRVIENTYFDSKRNTKYVSGPTREDIQRVTGRRVNPVGIQENNAPGQDMRNGQMHLYRPEVTKNNDREQRAAPARIVNLKDVRQPSERNATNQPRNVNPANNTRPEAQRNTVNPRINNNNQNSVQPRNTNSSDNRREVQRNTVNPPNNNNNTKAVQPERAKPAQNTKKEKPPVVVKPSTKKQAEPPKKSKTEENRRKVEKQQPISC